MALTAAQFKARFPEFVNTPDLHVEAKLSEALRDIGTAWGTKADDGQAWLAAHMLATAPFGQQSRLTSEKARSTYLEHYEGLRKRVACLLRSP